MRSTFRSLRVRNYRLFASGQLVSLTGTWMQRAGQDWLVTQLVHPAGTAVGITTGLQFLPILLFGLKGGVIADRFPKRRTLFATQTAMGLVALALGLLVLERAVTLHEVYLLAFLLGCATAVDNPVRQSFVSEMVGPDEIGNAIGLNSATFNSARMVGPSVAGLMIGTVGIAWVFLSNAISFVAVICGLLAIRESELFPTPRLPRAKGQVREGLAYVSGRRQLVVPIILMGVVGMLGFNFQITLVLLDKTVFHRGAAAYGLLTSLLAAGCVIGALLGARRERPTLRLLLVAALAFGLLETLAALSPSYVALGAILVPIGLVSMLLTTTANSTVQLNSDPAMRGRVMGLYMLVFAGTTPIGAPLVGWMSQVLGARWGLLIGGVASLGVALCLIAVLRRHALAPAGAARGVPPGPVELEVEVGPNGVALPPAGVLGFAPLERGVDRPLGVARHP